MMGENFNPNVLRRIGKELGDLNTNPPEGVKLIINEKNMTDIRCVITGPEGTPFEKGQFKVQLVLGPDFPSSPPRGYFLTKVFHPNVATPSGEICVNTLKKDWNPELGIRHVLITIKCLLIAPNPESALNEEAGRLIMDDYDGYVSKAKMFTEIHALPKTKTMSPDRSRPAASSDGQRAAHSQKSKISASKKLLKRL